MPIIPSMTSGPVKIISKINTPVVASQRSLYPNASFTFFWEIPGIKIQ